MFVSYCMGLSWWLKWKRICLHCRRHRRCGFNPWFGKIPGEGNGSPLQYSCLESPIDRGPWWAIVHRVTELDMTKLVHVHTHTRPITYEIKHESFAWQLGLTLQNVPLILLQIIDCLPEHLSLFWLLLLWDLTLQ